MKKELHMKILASKYLFDGDSLLENKALIVDEQKRIIDIVDSSTVDTSGNNFHYYGNGVISPGFIDLQVNGCGGVAFNQDISIATLKTMYKTWLQHGTTYFLPTLITCDFADVISALNVVKDWFAEYGNTRGVIGIHLEGPFISKEKSGIHPQEYIIKPTNDLLLQIIAYRKYFPIKMTIAVEEFTSKQIQLLLDNNITLSIGHSNASYAQACSAIDLGVTTATHVFNAMSGLTARTPGVIGAILNSDIYTGVIADLVHVDAANIELLHKIKREHVYLVTDAVTPTATNMLQFEFANKSLYVHEGKCVDANGVLGGAALTMNQAVLNCVNHCGIALQDALKMAVIIPAKVLQLNPQMYLIKPGVAVDNVMYMDLISGECNRIIF